jgi:gluconate kinase
LNVPEQIAAQRAATRVGHFASAALVPSQFAVLEPPSADALVVDGTAAPDAIVAAVRKAFGV